MISSLNELPVAARSFIQSRFPQIARVSGVEKVILFGSYAQGTQSDDSDIDVAVFVRIDGSSLLELYRQFVRICLDDDLDVQVQVFSIDELMEPHGIVNEIVNGGFEYRIRPFPLFSEDEEVAKGR